MGQRLLRLRVRPARIAVLINGESGPDEFVGTVRFLSQVWGGKYCPVLPVDPGRADPLTNFRLGTLRPDFVYGVSLNDKVWGPAVNKSCQPW